jgi:hypothetical protein
VLLQNSLYVHQIRLDFNLPSSNLDLSPRIWLSLPLLARVIHCVGRGSFLPQAGPRLTNAQEGEMQTMKAGFGENNIDSHGLENHLSIPSVGRARRGAAASEARTSTSEMRKLQPAATERLRGPGLHRLIEPYLTSVLSAAMTIEPLV